MVIKEIEGVVGLLLSGDHLPLRLQKYPSWTRRQIV